MKLLVIARNYENFTSRQVTYSLINELRKITDLTIWHDRADNIHIILDKLGITPDFILILEYWETNATKVTGLRELSIPYAVSLQDLHWDVRLRTDLLKREQVTNIFTPSRPAFLKYYPELSDSMLWLPHHVNTEIFRDYQLDKEIDYLLMGLTSKTYYPFRARVVEGMKDVPGFVHHRHPGYREIGDDEGLFVREKYAREINRSKIFFTCGGNEQYPVAKYFEVLACNSLLLAPVFPELEELGFMPGVNFVDVTESDFREKADYYLHHEEERMEISQRGFDMIHSRHSSRIRAAELLDTLQQLLAAQV